MEYSKSVREAKPSDVSNGGTEMTLDQVKAKIQQITGGRLARAEQAIAAGIAIVTDPATGKKCAVVGSKSGNGSYVVKGTGCTCKGFKGHGYCAHSDAVYLMITARAAMKAEGTAGAAPAPLRPGQCADCGAPIASGRALCAGCATVASIEAAEALLEAA